MVYRVIGLMSGSSADGLDIAFVELQETSGKWVYTLQNAVCYPYPAAWADRLKNAKNLSALEYQLLHVEYGRYIGELVNRFIAENSLQYQVQLLASHGHTVFHVPGQKMTAQLGDGAAIAAVTGINTVSDLRAMDVALNGQGAPIVPVGEQLLLGEYLFFLNLGGIANISCNDPEKYIAYDVCPANKVLDMLAAHANKPFDDGGQLAARGTVNQGLLEVLNGLEYYRMPYPKSLSNDFGTDVVYPLIDLRTYDLDDALRTYTEHICQQVTKSAAAIKLETGTDMNGTETNRMLVTGGGAKNVFLMERLQELLAGVDISVEVPSADLIDFKEAIIMALIGVLRWREENNTYASVTGADRNSIGGAVWIGQEA